MLSTWTTNQFLKRKRDVEAFFAFSAIQFQALCTAFTSSYQLDEDLREEPDEEDIAVETDRERASQLRRMSIGLAAIASTFSGAGSRGPYDQIRKCQDLFPLSLSWPDLHFRFQYRLGRVTFDRIVHILEKNPIFKSKGKKPQRPVRYQLAAFLMRYGVRGAPALHAAHQLGIGEGTVYLYCDRVTRALRELGLKVLTWGDDIRHTEVSDYIMDRFGLPNCIGILDGTLIRLTELPLFMGAVFLCRKKYPAINVQGIVDHMKRFISFDMGWPGSVTDVTIWKHSHVWKHRQDYFKGENYVLADKGYPSSPYILRPFTEPETNNQTPNEKRRRKKFNKRVSGIRIRVEHAFGMLKGRFPSLKDLPPTRDMQDTYRVVQAMMVLHNLCLDLGDQPEAIPFFDPSDNGDDGVCDGNEVDVDIHDHGGANPDGDVQLPEWETDEWLKEAGRRKRDQILDDLFPI